MEIRLGIEVVVPSETDLQNWVEHTGLPEETYAPKANYTKLINAEWLDNKVTETEWEDEDKNIEYVEILDDTFLIEIPIQRDLSPFINAFHQMGNNIEEFQKANVIRRHAAFDLWPKLEQLLLHYRRRQWILFDKLLEKIYPMNAPEAIADKTRILFESIERYGLIFCKDDSLHKVIRQRLIQAEQRSRAETVKLVNYFKTPRKDIAIEGQLHDIRRRWSKLFSALAALYTTHYWDASKYQITNFTLGQKRFDELKSLYVDTFETFCRISVMAAGIEGIISVGRAVVPKASGEFTLEEFDVFKNGSKPDILRRFGTPVSDLFVPYIDHNLRNGIGHNSATYDVVSDQVRYNTENARGIRHHSVRYILFCESVFKLYIQLEVVSVYVSWVRLFYRAKDGATFLFQNE